jgi:hypothetical protein
MEDAVRGRADMIGQVSLLWRAVYHVIAELRDRGTPGFHVVSHEEVSLDPVGGFGRLYRAIDLPYTDAARKTIVWGSLSPAGTRGAERPHVWTLRGGLSKTAFRPLDSRENVQRWRRYLSEEDAARVRALTEDVASRFYSGDEPWW